MCACHWPAVGESSDSELRGWAASVEAPVCGTAAAHDRDCGRVTRRPRQQVCAEHSLVSYAAVYLGRCKTYRRGLIVPSLGLLLSTSLYLGRRSISETEPSRWGLAAYAGTALHCAAHSSNTSALSLLLNVEGVDVNSFSGFGGRTPVHVAASNGRCVAGCWRLFSARQRGRCPVRLFCSLTWRCLCCVLCVVCASWVFAARTRLWHCVGS